MAQNFGNKPSSLSCGKAAFALTLLLGTAWVAPAHASFQWRGPVEQPSAAAPQPVPAQPAANAGMSDLSPVIAWDGSDAAQPPMVSKEKKSNAVQDKAAVVAPALPPAVMKAETKPVAEPVAVATEPEMKEIQSAPVAAPVKNEAVAVAHPVAPVVDKDVLDGFGSDLPLVMAMQQIVPLGYQYAFASGVNVGQVVSWQGGKKWQDVLNQTLESKNLEAKIQGNVVTVVPRGSKTAEASVQEANSKAVSDDKAVNDDVALVPALKESEMKDTELTSEDKALASAKDKEASAAVKSVEAKVEDAPVAKPATGVVADGGKPVDIRREKSGFFSRVFKGEEERTAGEKSRVKAVETKTTKTPQAQADVVMEKKDAKPIEEKAKETKPDVTSTGEEKKTNQADPVTASVETPVETQKVAAKEPVSAPKETMAVAEAPVAKDVVAVKKEGKQEELATVSSSKPLPPSLPTTSMAKVSAPAVAETASAEPKRHKIVISSPVPPSVRGEVPMVDAQVATSSARFAPVAPAAVAATEPVWTPPPLPTLSASAAPSPVKPQPMQKKTEVASAMPKATTSVAKASAVSSLAAQSAPEKAQAAQLAQPKNPAKNPDVQVAVTAPPTEELALAPAVAAPKATAKTAAPAALPEVAVATVPVVPPQPIAAGSRVSAAQPLEVPQNLSQIQPAATSKQTQSMSDVEPKWHGAKGQTLRDVLKSWSELAGVELYWSIDYDYRLSDDLAYAGTYDEAVGKVMDRFTSVRPQPYGELHQSNQGSRVLVIKSYDLK